MATRHIPLALKHSPSPKIEHFALLTGLEAGVRGIVGSVMPLIVYEALGTAQLTSSVYFITGCLSLIWGLMVPALSRKLPRRWVYTLGCLLYLLGMSLALLGHAALALVFNTLATATTYICIQAYVLDYVQRENLGRSQSVQLFYAAFPWTVGPVAGVFLYGMWRPLPFLIAIGFTLTVLVVFWRLRLGNGKQIQRARAPAINPLGFLGPFLRQPRLIAGWLFAVIRSCGWWVFIVYLPIFCVENGLGEQLGGTVYSLSNGFLFFAPVINRWARGLSIRRSVQMAFLVGGSLLILAAALSFMPLMTVLLIFTASVAFVTLDVVGGLPFLLAVRPAERTEMSAVYSSFRDVSGILTPGMAWLVLAVAPLPGVFAATGVAFLFGWLMARNLHPRLGCARPSHGGAGRGSEGDSGDGS